MKDLLSREPIKTRGVHVPRAILALAGAIAGLATLKWPFNVALATVRGQGAFDPTIAAFTVTFVLGAVGLPGYLASLAPTPATTARTRVWLRASLLAMLASSLATLGWIGMSVVAIGPTLTGARIALELAAPLAAAAICVWRRRHV